MNLKLMLPLLVVSTFLTSCVDRHGVIGANFRLAKDSRLPAWFNNTSDYPNAQLSVEITRYEAIFTDKCKIRINIYSPDGKILKEAIGISWLHPETANHPKREYPLKYPRWSIYRINNTNEVYEHTEAGPILRIVDKPIPKQEQ